MKHTARTYILVPFILLVACGSGPDRGEVVARAGDAELYEADLKEAVPPGLNERDSLLFLQGYVTRWTREQLIYQLALENLPEEEARIDEEVQQYKRSLMIFAYENELVRKKLDTTVTAADIETYFNEHKSDFALQQNIVKYHLMIFPQDAKNSEKALKLFSSPGTEDLSELTRFCSETAYQCSLEDEWVTMEELKMLVKPLPAWLESNNLGSGKTYRFTDSTLTYALKINELKINKDIPPLDFVKNEIREIILNKRKTVLLNAIRTEIFTEAEKKKTTEIYLPLK